MLAKATQAPGWPPVGARVVHVAPGGQVAALDELDLVRGRGSPALPGRPAPTSMHAGPVVPADQDRVAGRPVVRRAREHVRGVGLVEQAPYDVGADVGQVHQRHQAAGRVAVRERATARRAARRPCPRPSRGVDHDRHVVPVEQRPRLVGRRPEHHHDAVAAGAATRPPDQPALDERLGPAHPAPGARGQQQSGRGHGTILPGTRHSHMCSNRRSVTGMTIDFQASLLDAALEAGRSASGRWRVGCGAPLLSRGAWVDVLPGWFEGADEVFAELRRARCPWRAERRPMYDNVVDVPRLLHTYGVGEQLPHPALTEAREALLGPLPRRAGRAVRDGRLLLLPRRPRLGGVARRQHRPRPLAGHHGRDRLLRLAAQAAAAARRRPHRGQPRPRATAT